MKIKIAAIAGLAAMMTLGACNTVEGTGKDLKSAGSAIENASGQKGKN
jgi:predicted small secreted protein